MDGDDIDLGYSTVAPVDVAVSDVAIGLPSETVDRLRAFFNAAAAGGLAPKSLAALRSDGRVFAAWCAENRQSWLPAAPQTVADFVASMASQGKRPATVQRYLASIASWHKAAEFVSPTTHPLVKMARKAHLRSAGARQRQAEPVGETEIQKIMAAMEAEIASSDAMVRLTALRDRAYLLVAHDTLARASELVEMRWEDLAVDAGGDGRILIRRSKTDQEGHGKQCWLDRSTVAALNDWRREHDVQLERQAADEEEKACRVRAERVRARWPQGRKRKHPQREAIRLEWSPTPFLFRGLTPHYEYEKEVIPGLIARRGRLIRAHGWSLQLSAGAISLILKRRIADIGIDPIGYSAHSTRVGMAQDLLAAGADLLGAMDAGRWKSPTMPARYAERILAGRGAVAKYKRRRRQAAEGDDSDS